MCKVYNQIGCLTSIQSHLHTHGINNYQSLSDLINFQNTYYDTRKQIIVTHQLLIEQEKNTLGDKITLLDYSIKTEKRKVKQQLLLELKRLKGHLNNLPIVHNNIIGRLTIYVKRAFFKLKIWYKKLTFNSKITDSLKHLVNNYKQANNRHNYINSHFDDAVMESYLPQVQKLDREKDLIDQINNSIYGALGEEQVVKELKKLSDDYILINDFTCRFNPAISYQQGADYIKSIQIDHILVAPSGVFLIETKNWSEHSLSNRNLYSPIEQIKRSNFALYKLLNGKTSKSRLNLTNHWWGHKKVMLKNLVVFTNHKPMEEFQYVKTLTLNKLLGYIKYFEPCFSDLETQKIAEYLLSIKGSY